MTMIFLLAVSGLLQGLIFHPIHISVCEIEHDRERKALEITQRIFIDDLEKELRKESGNDTLVITEINSEEADRLLEAYMRRHVRIYLSGSERSWQYVGYEFEQDAIYIYFQVTKVKSAQAVGVMNTVLLKTYDDQVNLVHVRVGDALKSMKLEGRIYQDEVKFN